MEENLKNHSASISPSASLIARFLVLVAGYFGHINSLTRSIRLSLLSIISITDIICQ
jgi:hypothetical protein